MKLYTRFTLCLIVLALLLSRPFAVLKPACVFCDPVIIQRQQFYEDAYVRGLHDAHPLIEGHKLVIPKRHVGRFEELNDQEMLAVKHLINRIESPHYWILQKNNLMQSVPHVHFHVIPKPVGMRDWVFIVQILTSRLF